MGRSATATVSRPGTDRGSAPAILAIPEADGAIRCVACAHRCLIRPGRSGICRVRREEHGSLRTLVYGELVATAVEPIEKKPLFHAWPGSVAYSVATRGCNFHCRYCQNWEIAQADREGLAPPVIHREPEEVVAAALTAGARSIAYTYVEPTIFIEFVLDTARLAHHAGLGNVLVTNGYQTPEALDLLAPLVDAANVDLKAFSDATYRRVCGARLDPVLETLVGMRRRDIWVEVTTLLVPGLNDDSDELTDLARWLVANLGAETPWHVSRFFPAYRMADVSPTPATTVAMAAEIGRAAGLRHVYPGNLGAATDDDTTCPGCGTTLIRRRGYRGVASRLVHGACPSCGLRPAGIGLDPGRRA